VVQDELPGLYGLKYNSVTAYGLPLYLCSYKLVGSATRIKQDTPNKGQSFFKCPRNGVSCAVSPYLSISLFANLGFNSYEMVVFVESKVMWRL